MALELLRLVSTKEITGTAVVTHQMDSGDISRLEAIANELKGLESRLSTDTIQQGVADAEVVNVSTDKNIHRQ